MKKTTENVSNVVVVLGLTVVVFRPLNGELPRQPEENEQNIQRLKLNILLFTIIRKK